MKSGTTYSPGQIILISFPYSDLRSKKRRPVLVLTAEDHYGDFIGLAVTTNPSHEHSHPVTMQDLKGGYLPRSSWVRTDKLFTLEASHVIKSLATLSPGASGSVLQSVCGYIGCSTL
jgi:mRNA interferase MazF